MLTGRAAPPDALRSAVASRPRSRSRPRPLHDFGEIGKKAGSRLPPASQAQYSRARPIRFPRCAASGDGPYRGDERQESAPQLVGHPLHERADSEESRQPRQDEQRASAMKEVVVALTYLEEPLQPRQDGQRARAVKEVAVSLTIGGSVGLIGASVGLALAWGYGLPVAL